LEEGHQGDRFKSKSREEDERLLSEQPMKEKAQREMRELVQREPLADKSDKINERER